MRILIAAVTAGGGHLQAGAALEEAWRVYRPEDVLEKVDVLDFVSQLRKRVYSEGFLQLVEHAPEIWGLMFKRSDNPELIQRLTKFRRAIAGTTNHRFVRYLEQTAPDAVLCVHYLPLEILGHLRQKSEKRSPMTVCVITDFEAHALWMEAGVDLYCVAAEETKARLIARGVAAENIVATGIPVSARFSAKADPKKIRQALGLRDDQPILLVLGGGFGVGPVGEILVELDKMERAFQVLVVAGRNPELRASLAAQDRRHPTHVLGFVNNMHQLMAVADLIITKPGGLTSSEALALGKPILILNPIPGQEAANSDFLLEHGAAAKVNRVEDLPYRIEQLLGTKKLADMAKAAKLLGRPRAARDICDEVVARVSAKEARVGEVEAGTVDAI